MYLVLLQAYAAADSSKLEEEAAAEDASPSVPEVLWGQRVESLAVNGIEETPRKFLAHVRRALILYIHLLMDVGDLDTLCGAVRALRREATLYSDICRSGFAVVASALNRRLSYCLHCLPSFAE